MEEEIIQGLEVECFIADKEDILGNSKRYKISYPNEINKLIGSKLWKPSEWDTGYSTEINLFPHNNLEDFCENTVDIFTEIIEFVNKNEALIMLIGVSPISYWAGTHIHNSLGTKYFTLYKGNKAIKDRLYLFQPFISLLGQNSSLIKERRKYCGPLFDKFILSKKKDSRLFYYSGYNGYYVNNSTYDYTRDYGLRMGLDLRTLEVRFPSSASLYQILTLVTFIRSCIKYKLTSVKSLSPIRKLCKSLIELGGNTPVKLIQGSAKFIIPIGKLFKLIVENSPFKYCLEDSLNELPISVKGDIEYIIDLFKHNYSFTDFYNLLLKHKERYKSCISLHEVTEYEFFKDSSFIKELPKPGIPFIDVASLLINNNIPTVNASIFKIDSDAILNIEKKPEENWEQDNFKDKMYSYLEDREKKGNKDRKKYLAAKKREIMRYIIKEGD